MPFKTPGTTNGGPIDPGTSARQQMTAPVTTGQSSDPTGISRLLRRIECVQRAYKESDGPAARIFLQETSYDFGDIGRMIFEAIAVASAALLATSGIGAVLGAAVGALGGGVGAVPGAVVGAKLGLSAGLWLLNALGLGFLAFYIGERLGEVIAHYRIGIALAWDAGDHEAPTVRDAIVAEAAEEVGRGKALLLKLILEGIVAAIAARGLAYVVGQLRASKFGKDFALWVEQHADRLLNDPKFRATPKTTPPGGTPGSRASGSTGRSSSSRGGGRKEPEETTGRGTGSAARNPATLGGSMSRARPAEQRTAKRLAEQHPEFDGRKFDTPPPPDPGYDWVDDLGRKYDAMGDGTASKHFKLDQFKDAIDKHLLKGNDFTVIDMTGHTPSQIAGVKNYVDALPAAKQATIRRIGF